jgi:hypothetical protein
VRNANNSFQEILEKARTLRLGETLGTQLIDELNTRVVSGEAAARLVGGNAVWISDTHKRVDEFNDSTFRRMRLNGSPGFRLFARHSLGNNGGIYDSAINERLFQKKSWKNGDISHQPYVDLCIGMPVICCQNLAVSLGIFNGSYGVVVGFGFYGNFYPVDQATPALADAHKLVNRQLPVVFVRLEKYSGPAMWEHDPKVVPFTEYCDTKASFQVNGTSYMRHFMPLQAAAAITTTKSQSLTAKDGVVYDVRSRGEKGGARIFARGLAYVGISRATDLAKLWLLNEIDDGFFNTHDDEREEISQEYARLLHLFPQGGTILDDPGGSGIGESACWNQGYES